ncbi:MAG TPA: cytochrome P450 [Pseudonocardiaceae bacterium]|jgi:cytochrome P450
MTTTVLYEPMDPATLADPYSVYHALRSSAPVFWHDRLESWILTRYRDCLAVLQDVHTFAADPRRGGQDVPESKLTVQFLDPPEQVPVRRMFISALRGQDMDAICARAEKMLAARFARLACEPVFDFVTEVGNPLALFTICALMGIEEPDQEQFTALSDAVVYRMDTSLAPPDRPRSTVSIPQELNRVAAGWFDTIGETGVIGAVKRALAAQPGTVSEDLVRNTARIMLMSGFGSPAAAASNAMLALLRHPGTLAALADPALLETGIDELVRYDGPVQGSSRTVTETIEFAGRTFRQGELVTTLFGAANHDPDQFHDPDQLVLDRSPNRHLGFGWGPHVCIGARFTQLVLRSMVRALRSWPQPLILAGEPEHWPSATVRYLRSLPVSFAR